MAAVSRVLVLVYALLAAPGCLVLTIAPSHDRESLVWEPALLGEWQSQEDNSSLTIGQSEWQSYSIEYSHPIEKGRLTGYLTTIGRERYLDVMPARGEDRGAFLLPLHGVVRVRLDSDRLELTALSYDWFFDRLKKKAPIPGLQVVLDEKENALIVSPAPAVRAWLRKQAANGAIFGASAVFTRVKKQAGARSAPASVPNLGPGDLRHRSEHVVERHALPGLEVFRH